MDPIITLPYSEWVIAQQLVKSFPVREGYSVFAPLSRQEKGVDLVLVQRRRGPTRAASIQVKFSRTYDKPPSRGYKFATSFNNFTAPEQADFFALLSLYPTNEGSHRGAASVLVDTADFVVHVQRDVRFSRFCENGTWHARQDVRLRFFVTRTCRSGPWRSTAAS